MLRQLITPEHRQSAKASNVAWRGDSLKHAEQGHQDQDREHRAARRPRDRVSTT